MAGNDKSKKLKKMRRYLAVEAVILLALALTVGTVAWYNSGGSEREAGIGTGSVKYEPVMKEKYQVSTEGAINIFNTEFQIRNVGGGSYEDEEGTGTGGGSGTITGAAINGCPYLPGGSQIIAEPLDFHNLSTVNTKLRMRVAWEYSDLFGEEVTNTLVGDIESIRTSERIHSIHDGYYEAPLLVEFTNPAMWHNVDDGLYTLTTENEEQSACWNVTKVQFPSDSQGNVTTDLTNAEEVTAVLEQRPIGFIDAAETFYYYGAAPYDSYTSAAALDYGDSVPATIIFGTDGQPTTTSLQASIINTIKEIDVSQSYTAYSKLKKFTVTITLQVRQGDFFIPGSSGTGEADGWFDVYTATFGGSGA